MSTRMKSYERIVQSLCEEILALESRCSVAEDLNKIYVRMYLDMQERANKAIDKRYAATSWRDSAGRMK